MTTGQEILATHWIRHLDGTVCETTRNVTLTLTALGYRRDLIRSGRDTESTNHLVKRAKERPEIAETIDIVRNDVIVRSPFDIALHSKVGFTESGTLKNVGYKFGKYIDVDLWQMSVV